MLASSSLTLRRHRSQQPTAAPLPCLPIPAALFCIGYKMSFSYGEPLNKMLALKAPKR